MKHINRFTISITTLGFAIALVVITQIPRVYAAQYFGGMRTATLTCTCSGNVLVYVNDYKSNRVLALSYNGTGRLFATGNIFGTYLLGSYTPGGVCKVGVPPYCTDLTVDGTFDSSPGTGTSGF